MVIEENSSRRCSLELHINEYQREQAIELRAFFLHLWQSSGFLDLKNHGQLERLGIVLAGPALIEIAGLKMALDAAGIEGKILGIEQHAGSFEALRKAMQYPPDGGKASLGKHHVQLVQGDAADGGHVQNLKRSAVDGYMAFTGNMGIDPHWAMVISNWSALIGSNKPALFVGTANVPFGNVEDSQVSAARSYFAQGLAPVWDRLRDVSLREGNNGINPHAFISGKDFPYNHGVDVAYVYMPHRRR